ncbi:MAG: response regulator [Oscillospiraceae bacterium]|nr:response regulator [Oscillospiraceae bacterium]
MDTEKKRKTAKPIRFLIITFLLLLAVSICAFIWLGNYMRTSSEEGVHKVGNLYMEGMSDQITSHFRTLIEMRIEQTESLVEMVSADEYKENASELYSELVYRAGSLNFNYIALASEDGELQMLYGEQISLSDSDAFFESLGSGEKKIAVGENARGKRVVVFGVEGHYPMSTGEASHSLLTAVPIDYFKSMLHSDPGNSLMYSNIIRADGSFILSDMDSDYSDYFESLYARYNTDDFQTITNYINDLSNAMNSKQSISLIFDVESSTHQIYYSPLPYSEWHLITVLPYGELNTTVSALNKHQTWATIIVCAIIFISLTVIFIFYFRLAALQLREIEKARNEALEASQAKSMFLSNMSHDIRTPMNAIVGMTAIATTHIDDKEQVQNCLKKITLSSKHLLGLINDVLDMSKIESGKMTLAEERVSLKEIIEGVVGIVQSQIKAKGQHFNVIIDNIIAEDVLCDSVRLNQILLNLLSNAVKYTQEGGIINLSLFEENSPKGEEYVRCHIVVKDNGIGMTEEFLERVFDSYSRADSKRVHKTEGAGLGMAITKHIVDAMSGSIEVESKLNEGTEFHVILDLETADGDETEMFLPPWKMLVVDDDETLCRTSVSALLSIGIQADWTLSGEKALELVKKHHDSHDEYQIILLDWRLPGMDGIWAAKQIRQIVGDEMPIILISAYDWSELEDEARAAGINGFIAKPLFKSTLFYGIKKYMNAAKEEPPEETAGKPEQGLTGRRVLVAEDNELNWEILSDLLTDEGIETDWAENGKVCLEKFESSEAGYYDAVLMDVRMPVMNGYEATEAIRGLSRPDSKTIPIIAMTADAFAEDIKKCLDSGMNAHTSKPINLEKVLNLLREHIK